MSTPLVVMRITFSVFILLRSSFFCGSIRPVHFNGPKLNLTKYSDCIQAAERGGSNSTGLKK